MWAKPYEKVERISIKGREKVLKTKKISNQEEKVLSTESSTSSRNKGGKVLLIAIIVFIIVSVSCIGYPLISQLVNSIWARGSVVEYNKQVDAMPEDVKNKIMKDAEEYNKRAFTAVKDPFSHTEEDKDYEDVLNVYEDGQMGTIVIPCIDCELPIYHTTPDDKGLTKGAAHLLNTSLPIGGEGNHCAISAHTALPGKELFNRLDEVVNGDLFYITVLDVTRAYKVTNISIVEPNNIDALQRVPGKDLCTLVTCTPYAVNTHRLLVTGERSPENDKDLSTLLEETKNPIKDMWWLYLIIIGLVILILIILVALVIKHKKSKSAKPHEEVSNADSVDEGKSSVEDTINKDEDGKVVEKQGEDN